MKMTTLNKEYWDNRYEKNKTGWNIGYISTPIKTYVDQLTDKSIRILIPGAGNSYEAEYLWKKGFKNIFVIDIAKIPLQNLKSRVVDFPDDHLIHGDFFDLRGSFDLIFEQTFFCALNPNLRPAYVNKTFHLLKPKGKIVGLLFNFPLSSDGPPFGGSKTEYNELFTDNYSINTLEPATNSIKERQGKELFFIFEKKEDVLN